MSRQLSYADAAKILGGGQSKIFSALDKIVGGLLLGGSVIGVPDILGWFDAKGEFVRLTREAVASLAGWRVGAIRHDRSDQLRAAHAALALAAFIEEVSRLHLPFDVSKLKLDKRDAINFGGGRVTFVKISRAFVEDLLKTAVPMPNPIDTRETFLRAMTAFYDGMTKRFVDLVKGLEIWDRIDEVARESVESKSGDLSRRSLIRYEEFFISLAGEFPEVACWANFASHSATQHEISAVRISLRRIEKFLQSNAENVPQGVWDGIARSNRAALTRPILEAADVPHGLIFPDLSSLYIDPRYRVARCSPNAAISRDDSWAEFEARDDLAELLVGNLLTPEAVSAPIVVLGHPGSGKSVLTRVLAARLPPDQFIAVRVPLREVPADADLQEQIESAIRLATGVTVSWPVLAGQTGGALPVILLDGFDELLQATGVNQSDYLLKIADFQRRETEQGRAAAVIVTSRITVADRARIPRDTLALRLEPFSDVQIKQWLRVWNQTNDAYFTLTGIAPFTFKFALSHKELSTQPLLLLMLAIYDADANGLQKQGTRGLTEGQLYEKLLLRFAYREVTKVGLGNSEAEVAASVEDELTRLSIIALAMFNRGAQSATEQEIDNDLVSMLGRRAVPQDRTDFRVQLGQAERALGRFFFIQRLTANRGGRELAIYEFLHATFAEYLVARLIWKELEYLRRRLELSTHAVLIQAALDDSSLYKLMSYSALCVRTPILKFVADFARSLNVERRAEITRVVLAVLSTGMTRESDPPGNTYSPSVTNPVRRRAIYSVNLVLLAMLVCEELHISQLFPEVDDPAREWRCHTLLWQSQLRDEEWSSLLECMTVLRKPVLINGARDAIIRPADGRYGRFHSLTWSIANHPERREPAGTIVSWRPEYSPVAMQRYATVMSSPAADYAMHLLEPILDTVGDFAAYCIETVNIQNAADPNWEARSGIRDLLDVLIALPQEDPNWRILSYRRLTDMMVTLQGISGESPVWKFSIFERIQTLYYGVLGSDSDLPPRLLLELTGPLRLSAGPARQLVRSMIAALGRDAAADSDLIRRLGTLFDCFEFGEEISVEAWLSLCELGYLNLADWAWTDASLRACKGLDSERLAAERPDLAKRLRFVAGRDGDGPARG